MSKTHEEIEEDAVKTVKSWSQQAAFALSVVSTMFSLLVWPLGGWVWTTNNRVVVLEQKISRMQEDIDENTEEARKVQLIQQDIGYIRGTLDKLSTDIEKALVAK